MHKSLQLLMQAGAPANDVECTYVVGVGLVPQFADASEVLSQLYSAEVLQTVARRVAAYGSAFERALAAVKVGHNLCLAGKKQRFTLV